MKLLEIDAIPVSWAEGTVGFNGKNAWQALLKLSRENWQKAGLGQR